MRTRSARTGMTSASSMWSRQAVNGDVAELLFDDESFHRAESEQATVKILEPGSSGSDAVKKELPDDLAPFLRSSFVELLPHGLQNLNATLKITKGEGQFCARSDLVLIRQERPGAKWEALDQEVHLSDGGKCASVAIQSFSHDVLVDQDALETRDLDRLDAIRARAPSV